MNPNNKVPQSSTRKDSNAPQHRGVRSGGSMVSGDAKSPKNGGRPIMPPAR